MFIANKRRNSFPRSARSAWECILDALRPLCCMSEEKAQGTQSVAERPIASHMHSHAERGIDQLIMNKKRHKY